MSTHSDCTAHAARTISNRGHGDLMLDGDNHSTQLICHGRCEKLRLKQLPTTSTSNGRGCWVADGRNLNTVNILRNIFLHRDDFDIRKLGFLGFLPSSNWDWDIPVSTESISASFSASTLENGTSWHQKLQGNWSHCSVNFKSSFNKNRKKKQEKQQSRNFPRNHPEIGKGAFHSTAIRRPKVMVESWQNRQRNHQSLRPLNQPVVL